MSLIRATSNASVPGPSRDGASGEPACYHMISGLSSVLSIVITTSHLISMLEGHRPIPFKSSLFLAFFFPSAGLEASRLKGPGQGLPSSNVTHEGTRSPPSILTSTHDMTSPRDVTYILSHIYYDSTIGAVRCISTSTSRSFRFSIVPKAAVCFFERVGDF